MMINRMEIDVKAIFVNSCSKMLHTMGSSEEFRGTRQCYLTKKVNEYQQVRLEAEWKWCVFSIPFAYLEYASRDSWARSEYHNMVI